MEHVQKSTIQILNNILDLVVLFHIVIVLACLVEAENFGCGVAIVHSYINEHKSDLRWAQLRSHSEEGIRKPPEQNGGNNEQKKSTARKTNCVD